VPNRGTAGFSSVWVVFRMRTVGKHSWQCHFPSPTFPSSVLCSNHSCEIQRKHPVTGNLKAGCHLQRSLLDEVEHGWNLTQLTVYNFGHVQPRWPNTWFPWGRADRTMELDQRCCIISRSK
jgi:hypothetical protein